MQLDHGGPVPAQVVVQVDIADSQAWHGNLRSAGGLRLQYDLMRLTSVTQMVLPEGHLRSLVLTPTDTGEQVPGSFDQLRHVGAGDRDGSWMAVAFTLPEVVADAMLEQAWRTLVHRHGTLRTRFESNGSQPPTLWRTAPGEAVWTDHPDGPEPSRDRLREVLDDTCRPFGNPSHRLLTVTDPNEPRATMTVVIGADHAHVDAWSLLALVRDLTAVLDDLRAGREPGARLPPAADFADHTRALAARGATPAPVVERWHQIITGGGGVMPTFPLPLGRLDPPPEQVVVVHDVFDPDEVETFQAWAHERGTRMLPVAVSVLVGVTAHLSGQPLRAVLPVHSRYEARWHDAVGWFITNSVLECDDPELGACTRAVAEAIELGSHPLSDIMRRYGGMPQGPGMFALSWLDNRRLPISVPAATAAQHVSARIRTDGVMVWFVVNHDGLHLRCRYPDTPIARANVEAWLSAVQEGLRAILD